jgi:tetratricopeptide (TPR) repeat protein
MNKYIEMHTNYLQKLILIFIVLLLSGCTGLRSQLNYVKSSDLFQDKKYIHAYFYAKQAVDNQPDNLKYVTMLAWTLLKQGRIERAAKIIAPFAKEAKDNVDLIQINAWICYSFDNNEKALEWFQKELVWAKKQTDDKSKICQSIQSDAYYGMGLIHSRMQQFEAARNNFQKAMSFENQFIGHRPIALSYALTFFVSKDYQRARKEYQKIAKDGPDEIIDTQIAWCWYYLGNYSKAEILQLKNFHDSRDKRPFLYGLIFSTYAQQKYAQSKKYLIKLISIDPWFADTKDIWDLMPQLNKGADISLKFAKCYGLRGNFKRASQICQMILKQYPNHCEAQRIDIWCELYQSHAIVALSQFNQFSVKESCDTIMGKLGQGISLMYLGYANDASKILNQIPIDSPYHFRAQMALGAIAYLKGDFESAITIYESKANKLFEIKDNFWPYLNLNTLGWSYIYNNEYQKAEKLFTQMNVMHNYLSGIHLFGLSWAKFKQGKTEDAITSLLEYRLNPFDHFKQSMLVANAFYLQSDYYEAIAIYEDNMHELPENELFFSWGSFALQNLGWCYIHTHQYEKALNTFLKLKSYHPAPINFNIYDNLGWGYYYQGLIDKAEDTFRHALTIAPTSQLARDGLRQIKRYRNRRNK